MRPGPGKSTCPYCSTAFRLRTGELVVWVSENAPIRHTVRCDGTLVHWCENGVDQPIAGRPHLESVKILP